MDNKTDNNEIIPESGAARWAFRLALIPILGLFLYMFAAFLALYQIGKGRTGFFFLRKGFWRMLRMTGAGVIGFAAIWFCPFYGEDKCYENEMYDRLTLTYLSPPNDLLGTGRGLMIRDFVWPVKHLKIGVWKYYSADHNVVKECRFRFGKETGRTTYYLHDKYFKGTVVQIEMKTGVPYSSFEIDMPLTNIKDLHIIPMKLTGTITEGKISGWFRIHHKDLIRAEFETNKLVINDEFPENRAFNFRFGLMPEQKDLKQYGYVAGAIFDVLTGKSGALNIYDENGQLSLSGQYDKDIPVGVWNYFENGKNTRIIKWKIQNGEPIPEDSRNIIGEN